MPYESTWSLTGVYWRYYGVVSYQEIQAQNWEFYSNPKSDTTKYVLIDALEVTGLDWPQDEIKKIAAFDVGGSSTIKNLKMAFVSDSEDVINKIAEYVEILIRQNTSWQFKLFETIREARQWCEYEEDNG